MRKTIVFGNGLGMALNPHGLSLASAIAAVWEDPGALSQQQKDLIGICLPPERRGGPPEGEDDLDALQQALAACDFLRRLTRESEVSWLSAHGVGFPSAVRRFIHRVASYFHSADGTLPFEFVSCLADFLQKTHSHVATLNYDNLLYQPLIEQKVLDGYRGVLIDGFLRDGFSPSNLERLSDARFGWYLHLHGSPLFYDDERGLTKKMAQSSLNVRGPVNESHIVLTHFKHKSSVISSSPLLSTYWDFFERALRESGEVILFGYSGLDEHLNERVSLFADRIKIKIIEWAGSGNSEDRRTFWRERFNSEVNLIHMASVLMFRNW